MTLAKEIFRRCNKSNGPFSEGISHAAKVIPNAGRFSVDESVMNAVERTEKTPFNRLLEALDHAHPPYPIMWIEWPSEGGVIGYLIEALEGTQGFHFRQFLTVHHMSSKLGFPIICNLGRILVTTAGFQHENTSEAQTSGDEAKKYSADIISMLLIINSPSQVISIDEPKDVARADRGRAAKGLPPLPNLRSIRLDVNRLRKIHEADGSTLPGQAVRSEHVVRGHFKFINNRMFWWSPHLRNRVESHEPAKPRDYRVVGS